MKQIAIIFAVLFSLTLPAQATPTKEFITSCTYGVLTGTLVGVASLAFTDQPGENLQNVARGASLGLYLGIALGVYVVYVVPGAEEEELNNIEVAPEEARLPKWQIYPTIAENKIDGFVVNWRALTF